MRIGILTLPLHTNYGGILQAYALQTVLERMGHEVVVFDTPNKVQIPSFWKYPLSLTKRIALRIVGGKNIVFIEQHFNRIRPVIAQNIQPFIDTKIHRKIIKKFYELRREDYDAIVVGSDQVWRPKMFQFCKEFSIDKAYLSFTKGWNIKRIAYAASFGTDKWEYTDVQTQKCKNLLKEFDSVSVRERGGVNLCFKYYDIDAIHVLDPTMLLLAEDYISLFRDAKVLKSKGTLLNYTLDETESIHKVLERVARSRHLVPFSVNNPYEYDETIPLNDRIKPSVETWLRGFYDAEFVVTDSFHACVFSIIFKKQFVVLGNKGRGMARFESLLDLFGLSDRLIDENTDIDGMKDIDYDEVYKKYHVMKQKSISFLTTNL